MIKKMLAFLFASSALAAGMLTFNNGVYPLPEPYLTECQILRERVHTNYVANGTEYLPQDMTDMLDFRQRVSDAMKIKIEGNTLDMWSCAWFTLDARKSGEVQKYRREKGLIH